jgi:hypothetical protein
MLIGLLGMTRSMIAFSNGHWIAGILWNPLTAPFLLTLFWTIAELMRNYFRGERMVLSKRCAWSWFGTLLIAWIAKFVTGPDWW